MITEMAKRRDPKRAVLTRKGKLHVVDFGCGTLAMQFGVALAAADALQRGQTLNSIKIDLIDSSQPMIDFGLKIWSRFKKEVENNERLADLSEACDRFFCNVGDGHFKALAERGTVVYSVPCFLSPSPPRQPS